LTALCDASKAHKFLYIQGGILHRDISENDIIIKDPENANGFTGMLIDLNLAKVVGSERSGARHKTGTMQFMAIGVLRKVAHTYRHDLESFFYVLLWISARRAWDRFGSWFEGRPKQSMLTDWVTGSFVEIARRKTYAMSVDGFEELWNEFPQISDRVKPLCKEIRVVTFPYEDGLFIGTPKESIRFHHPKR
jgi:serine/threonine protein kinase